LDGYEVSLHIFQNGYEASLYFFQDNNSHLTLKLVGQKNVVCSGKKNVVCVATTHFLSGKFTIVVVVLKTMQVDSISRSKSVFSPSI
jgi:hypothetical protein